MSSETVTDSSQDRSSSETTGAAEATLRALEEGWRLVDRRFADSAKAARELIKDAFETLRAQSRTLAKPAHEGLDEAQRYLVGRVKERPVTATLAGLGVGLIIGLLISSRGK